MNIPALGDEVCFHPSRGESLAAGQYLKARVSGIDENGRLSLTIIDEAGGVVSSRQGVIFMQDDRGNVPDSGYAVWPAEHKHEGVPPFDPAAKTRRGEVARAPAPTPGFDTARTGVVRTADQSPHNEHEHESPRPYQAPQPQQVTPAQPAVQHDASSVGSSPSKK